MRRRGAAVRRMRRATARMARRMAARMSTRMAATVTATACVGTRRGRYRRDQCRRGDRASEARSHPQPPMAPEARDHCADPSVLYL
jgi:hypothetical protein